VNLDCDDFQVCWRCDQTFTLKQMVTTRAGNLLCSKCTNELNNEAPRKCPVDGMEMAKKRVLDKFLIDKCKECDGVWFDKGELRAVQQAARDMGFQEGALSMIFPAVFF